MFAMVGRLSDDDEEEEPQAEGDEDGDQAAAAGPFFTGAVHGGVSLADVAKSGHRVYRVADLHTSSAPTLQALTKPLAKPGKMGNHSGFVRAC